MHSHAARSLRLRRLHHHSTAGLLIAPVDHSIADGPIVTRTSSLDRLMGHLAAGGVDAVIVHKGSVRHIHPDRFAEMSLIVHLNASTGHALDPDAKYMVTAVEEAIRIGADGVSVHVNMGSLEEHQQIQDLARIADACDRWNLPLMAMMYPRGPKITDPSDPALVAHAVTIAADLGADLVKTVYPGSVSRMLELTGICPIPVLVAGGPRRGSDTELLQFVADAMAGGAAGVAMGRNLFQAADPERLAKKIARLIHQYPIEPFTDITGGHHDGSAAVLA
ncbi:2-amino-3,7-dideoxy-D-threo-hept-6-ulosonate synthase [Dactylosporangium sp. NPDC051484]|uniref:2-amino-3,7-dideoxy-D-threo-hept-6-ulosonate synthase n=1 Tax=Dactylosporangium sp. NPDC051484 TaxID=3154942 RepID=UPI00344D03B7